jgi:hypothetical protein
MQKYQNNITSRTGDAVSGIAVSVGVVGGGLATIFADNAGTPKANPFTTDANGYFEFYVANGRYNITVPGGGYYDEMIADALEIEAEADASVKTAVLAAATGTGLVGHNPTGVGAAPTTTAAFLDAFKQYPSGQFYVEFGGKPNRVADRLLVGGASVNVGNNETVTPDWLTIYQIAKGRTNGFIQSAQSAILSTTNDNLQNGSSALVVAAETRKLIDGYNAAGLIAFGVANKATGAGHAYAGYFEAYRDLGVTGGAYGIEVDVMNYAAAAVTDPYQQATGQTVGIQIAAGGELPATGQFDVSAAINIQKNIGSTFTRGIVFGSTSLTGADGTTGTAEAIAMGNGHKIVWYSGAGVLTNSIYSVATTAAESIEQRFVNAAINFRTHLGKPVFQISAASGGAGVNYVSAQGANAAGAPTLAAAGDDTNIDLRILAKGTGVLSFGTYTAGAVAQAGYITVKDSGGTTRRLLVG